MQQNDLTMRWQVFRKSWRESPTIQSCSTCRPTCLRRRGAEPGSPEFQTAMRSAKKAVALRPTLGPARGVLAKLYLQAGQYSEAADQCRKALEIDPKDQTALYHLIQALRKTGKKARDPGAAEATCAAPPGSNEGRAGAISLQTGRRRRASQIEL